jgi:hypothetical protein
MSSPPFIDSIYRIHCPLGAQIVIFLFKVKLKVGVDNKRKRAGWDQPYMEKVLEIGML